MWVIELLYFIKYIVHFFYIENYAGIIPDGR